MKRGESMLLTGIIAVDQHWGAVNPYKFRDELDCYMFDRIRHMEQLDFIMFGGDTFDMKEYLSSNTVKCVLTFIEDLIEITEPLGTEIIFIEGTRTHDSLQLDTLSIIFNQIRNCTRIKFICSVCEDTIGDMRVLYIPEEYMTDQEEYYKPFFQKHYDLILGHGITDKIWYANRDKSIDLNHHTTAPIFKVDELCNIANYVFFGHIHEHRAYGPDNRFISVGPTTRWEYGKEWACGYYIVEYDTQSCLMDMEFVVNEDAQKLITRGIVLDSNINIESLDDMLDSLLETSKEVDGLRIVVSIPSGLNNFDSIRDFIITKVGQYSNVKLVLKLLDSETQETGSDDSEKMKLTEKILESTKTPIPTQILNFIRYKKNKDIPIEYIKDLLEVTENNE